MLGHVIRKVGVEPAVGVAHAHGAQGVSVVATAQRQKLAFAFGAGSLVELHRHFQRHLHAYRAAVGQEHMLEWGRSELDQQTAQGDGRLVGQTAKHHVGFAFQLLMHGRVQHRVVVAVNGGPPAAHAVHHITEPFDFQPHSTRTGYGVHGVGAVHAGVGVPNVLAVKLQVGGHRWSDWA